MKTILITGSTGFIGKNLLAELAKQGDYGVVIYTRTTSDEELKDFLIKADFIIHLAGVSRPQDPKEFYEGNSDLTEKITTLLLEHNLKTPIFYTSSVHAIMDNDFGKSKRLAEKYLLDYSSQTGTPLFILRLTNTFGRWAQPNTHSVVATFCHNVSHGIELTISDPEKEMILVYVDDVVSVIIDAIDDKNNELMQETSPHFYTLTKTYTKTLSQLAERIQMFKKNNGILEEEKSDEFTKRLYTTYKSYEE